jgi:hypothetical protein
MTWKRTRSAGVLGALILVCGRLSAVARGGAADEPAPKDQPPAPAVAAPGSSQTEPEYRFLLREGVSQDVVRFGYWGSQTSGSPVKVGEYQSLDASPFYDVDGLHSDGRRTLNYTVTGTDSETNALNLNFYQPGVEANVDYQRFPHLLGHENLGEFPSGTALDNNDNGAAGIHARQQQFLRQDNNIGEDYAFRVQELKSNFKWTVNDSVKVRLDVWGLRKEGERQANAMQECYPHTFTTTDPTLAAPPAQTGGNGATSHCHIVSQMQHIDWQTTEVKPIIEWNLGPVVLEYSRPMRVFTQDDQNVFRFYDSGGSAASEFGSPRYMEYGVAPDSTTQIDQLKISANLNCDNKLYGFLFNGDTQKKSDIVPPVATGSTPFVPPEGDQRISDRHFNGADVRWTNTSIENVTITAYGRTVGEQNEAAAFLIPGEETRPGTNVSNPAIEDDPTQITPINYQRTQLGTRYVWRPWGRGFGLGGLAINGGYEYSVIHRVGLEVDTGSDDPPFQGTIIEEETRSNTITIGPSVRWSPELDTYVRYKWCNTDQPLFATNSHQSASGAGFDYRALALNTALPTQDNMVEIGGTLMPTDRFMLNAWLGIDIQSQDIGQALVVRGTSAVTPLNAPAGFDSQSFPFGVNGFFRASDVWTLNGGVAYYTNFIDQDVAFGAGADHSMVPYGLLQNQWAYTSRASVFTLGSTYDVTTKLRLVGQAEYVRGLENADQIVGDPRFPATAAVTAGIPQNFRQEVDTTRLTFGIDYLISPRCTTYFRYVLYDYNDPADQARIAASTAPVTGLPLSGTSNMFLGGMSATF